MDNEKGSAFKVIIVGGSISGLTLANALARADIDFLVLEGHTQIDASIGGALTIVSNGLRILDQMGIYDDISKHLEPTADVFTYLKDGKLLGKMDTPRVMRQRHYYPVAWLPRQKLFKILYDRIPDKSKVLTGKKVKSVDQSDEGIVVRCEDGSEYAGNMTAGADGIHSTVRGEMWRHMEGSSKKARSQVKKDRKVMAAEYACLLGISTPIEGFVPGEIHRTWGEGFTTFVNVGEGNQVFWFVFTKMDQKYYHPDVPKFSKEDLDKRAEEFFDTPVGAGIKFRTVFESSISSAFVPLEEGTCNAWTWGRFACLGDAVHKTTPNIGQGASLAIEDAAGLANHIVHMLSSSSSPSPTHLSAELAKWEKSLRPRAKSICDGGAIFTRLEALANWPFKFAALYISPHLGGIFADLVSVADIGAPKLEFLPLPKRDGDDADLDDKSQRKLNWKVSLPVRIFWAVKLRLQ